jgi:hypothetical protein
MTPSYFKATHLINKQTFLYCSSLYANIKSSVNKPKKRVLKLLTPAPKSLQGGVKNGNLKSYAWAPLRTNVLVEYESTILT